MPARRGSHSRDHEHGMMSRASSRSTASGMSSEGGNICNKVVDSKYFNAIVTSTVLCNALQMGLEADYPGFKHAWIVSENIATAVFFCEMILKIIAKKCGYFSDRSNWLDAALTMMGVIDCWVLALLPGDFLDLQSVSVLRILRLFRLARVSKIARKIKAIVLVCVGLYRALETTFWVLVGLAIIMFVFAIFCTEYIGRPEAGIYPGFSTDSEMIDEQEVMINYNPHLFFGSMPSSMLTLFSIAIGGEWSEVVRPLAIKQPALVLVFLFYCILIVFGIMNVIMAIVVDNVLEESRKLDMEMDKTKLAQKNKLLRKIQHVLSGLDVDGDGVLDYDEIEAAFTDNPEFQELLKCCEFPAEWSPRELHYMLDSNGDGELQKNEFTTNVFRLMDSGSFQQICILQAGINQLKYLVKNSHSQLEHQIKDLKESFCNLQPMRFSGDASATASNADPTTLSARPTSAGQSAKSHICQIDSTSFGAGVSDALGSRLSELSAKGFASSPTAERTNQQFSSRLSLDEALQQMRDLLEHTERIVKTDAAGEKQQQVLTKGGRKSAGRCEQELLSQGQTTVWPYPVRRELQNDSKKLSYNEIVEIHDAAFAAMRETLHKEIALLAQGEDTLALSPSGSPVQATNALHEESSCLHMRNLSRNLSEGVHRVLPCPTAAQSGQVLRVGEFVNVPTSL